MEAAIYSLGRKMQPVAESLDASKAVGSGSLLIKQFRCQTLSLSAKRDHPDDFWDWDQTEMKGGFRMANRQLVVRMAAMRSRSAGNAPHGSLSSRHPHGDRQQFSQKPPNATGGLRRTLCFCITSPYAATRMLRVRLMALWVIERRRSRASLLRAERCRTRWLTD